ncbi:MAG: nitrate reductase subunit beta, partial [Pseudomonadota bacterium]
MATEAFPERGGCGFTFGDGCHGESKPSLFNGRSQTTTLVKPVESFDPQAEEARND